MSMWRRRFLFYLAVAFVSGNLFSRHLLSLFSNLGEHLSAAVVAALSLLYIIVLLFLRIRNIYVFISTFFCLGAMGFAINSFFTLRKCDSIFVNGVETDIECIVEDIGQSSKGKLRLKVSVTEKEKCMLYFSTSENLFGIKVGDTLFCAIRPMEIRNFNDSFDYVSYMAEQSIFYSGFISKERYYVHPCSSVSIPHRIVYIRNKISDLIPKVIPERNNDNYSIIKALAVGNKGDIEESLKESYRKSGAMHLLALSGLHVGIIYSFLSFLFSFLGNYPISKKIRSIIVLVILWAYALVTGMSTSISRAVLMVTIYDIGSMIGREKNGFNSLGISALIITLINPQAPSQISFQLSFSAMLGIFVINPILKDFPDKIKLPSLIKKPLLYLWGIAAMSIACQLTTAPLSFYHFGSYTPYFLLTNTFAIPLSVIIMTLLPISIFTINVPYLGEATSIILDNLLSILNYVIQIISQLQ